jgi:hypothetical protein
MTFVFNPNPTKVGIFRGFPKKARGYGGCCVVGLERGMGIYIRRVWWEWVFWFCGVMGRWVVMVLCFGVLLSQIY